MNRTLSDLGMRSLVRAFVGTVVFLMVLAWSISFSTRWILMPHRFCVINDPFLVWTMAVTNSVIAFVYFAIPAVLITVVRAVPEAFFSPRLIYLFATFIVACGCTHVMLVATIWWPVYYAQVAIDGVCALASAGTLIELLRARPALFRFVARLRYEERIGRGGHGGVAH